MQSSATVGLQAIYSSMTLNVGVRAHLAPIARKWGSQDPRTPTGSPPLPAIIPGSATDADYHDILMFTSRHYMYFINTLPFTLVVTYVNNGC